MPDGPSTLLDASIDVQSPVNVPKKGLRPPMGETVVTTMYPNLVAQLYIYIQRKRKIFPTGESLLAIPCLGGPVWFGHACNFF